MFEKLPIRSLGFLESLDYAIPRFVSEIFTSVFQILLEVPEIEIDLFIEAQNFKFCRLLDKSFQFITIKIYLTKNLIEKCLFYSILLHVDSQIIKTYS